MEKSVKLSIIIPCYNEELRIAQRFEDSYKFFKKNFRDFEVILIDDGSTDQTQKVLRNLYKNYPYTSFISYSPNQGKGYAIKKGVLSSSGEVVCFMDADFAVYLENMPIFYQEIKNGADLVIADRNKSQSELKGKVNYFRRFLGLTLANINNSILNLKGIKDTQCGFKFFNGKVARLLFKNLSTYRWLFDVEIISLARKKGYHIKSLPVSWEQIDQSKVNILKDLIPVIKDMLRIYWKNLIS